MVSRTAKVRYPLEFDSLPISVLKEAVFSIFQSGPILELSPGPCKEKLIKLPPRVAVWVEHLTPGTLEKALKTWLSAELKKL